MITGRLITGITEHLAPRLSEWLLACVIFGFGFKLLQPDDTFGSAPATYRILAKIAPEGWWGIGLFLLGSIRLGALILNGSFAWFAPWSPIVRTVSAFLSAGFFFAIAIGIYFGNAAGTGAYTYGLMFVFDCILVRLISREAGKARRRYENGSRPIA